MRRINTFEMRRENVSETEDLVGFAALRRNKWRRHGKAGRNTEKDSCEAKEHGLRLVGSDFKHEEP